MVLTGLDRLLRDPSRLQGRRYALLAHGASVTRQALPAHLALADACSRPTVLFGPEHGFYGVEQDMIAAAGGTDPWTGAPTVSLYGDDAHSLRPRAEAFEGLDLLVVDLQDVGSRYYTYAATAVWAGAVAAELGCEIWVLDRPNPLGGSTVEGATLRGGFESFVGAFHHPVRHGLTLGELMTLEARKAGWAGALEVFAMEGWTRSMSWRETGLPWIAPSPNMPTLTTALIYPGGCLVEATEVSEGRGTTRPFQLVGAPGIDPLTLLRRLEAEELPGVRFVPTYFRPQFQKHGGQVCGGVEVLVTDAAAFRPYLTGVLLLAALKVSAPGVFRWREAPYEFVTDRPAIDLLSGGPELRWALDEGASEGEIDRPRLDAWLASWGEDEAAFREERRPVLIYGDRAL